MRGVDLVNVGNVACVAVKVVRRKLDMLWSAVTVAMALRPPRLGGGPWRWPPPHSRAAHQIGRGLDQQLQLAAGLGGGGSIGECDMALFPRQERSG